MKTRISPLPLLVSLGLALLPHLASAQEASATVSASPVAPPAIAAQVTVDPAKLPYGVVDVVKLSRAQVSEDVITTYVLNSGTAYNLSPNEIVYLRDQGVSDHIINVMIDQRRALAGSVSQPSPAAPAQQPYAQQTDAQQTDAAASPGYAQTAPNAPSSSVYVIPYSTYPAYSYYNSYPYYPYYSYPYYGGFYGCGPVFYYGFGHGFHGHGGGFHGGGGIHVGHGGSGHSGHH